MDLEAWGGREQSKNARKDQQIPMQIGSVTPTHRISSQCRVYTRGVKYTTLFHPSSFQNIS